MRNLLVFLSFFIGSTFPVLAQSTFFPINSEEYLLIDRVEAMQGTLAPFSTSFKPLSRKESILYLHAAERKVNQNNSRLNSLDLYNIQRAISISGEWVESSTGLDAAVRSKKPILKYFYETEANFLHVQTEDFFLAVNPIIYTQGMKELHHGDLKYINLRGAEFRGRILDKVGFYTMLADNQEKPASYVSEREEQFHAFPGTDYYRKVKNGNYDMFLARGYVDINAINDHLNISFGYDHNFIGNGMRSLFLSHEAAPSTFLRFRSKLGRFDYENLFLELVEDYQRSGDQILPKKYAALHQLNFRVNSRLEIGLFESTVFAHENHFAADYLIPVIGYRSLSRAVGAPDKTSLGFHFKAIPFRSFQIYGQALFDQIKLNEIGKNWWGNQYGFQLGGKYFDAFTLPNLNLQGEVNVVRPFTYNSENELTNYTHYNQPLAHPYGAGFAEFIGLANYQPIPKLYLTARASYSMRGTDSASALNFGNDLFKNPMTRTNDYDVDLIAGKQLNSIYMNFNAAFEWRPRLFIEAGATHYRRKYEDGIQLPSSTAFYGGLRWNFARKEYY